MMATINNKPDYFGSPTKAIWQLLDICTGGSVILGPSITADLEVNNILQSNHLSGEIFQVNLLGTNENLVLHIPPQKTYNNYYSIKSIYNKICHTCLI